MKNELQYLKYTCPKCGNKDYKIETISATGGFWTKIFDIQNKKFSAVICSKCTYTEFYRTKSSKLENVFDFFTN